VSQLTLTSVAGAFSNKGQRRNGILTVPSAKSIELLRY